MLKQIAKLFKAFLPKKLWLRKIYAALTRDRFAELEAKIDTISRNVDFANSVILAISCNVDFANAYLTLSKPEILDRLTDLNGKIDAVNHKWDTPDIVQVEEMINFCNHKTVYIYDCKEPQQLIVKFLKMCGIEVAGMIAEDKNTQDAKNSKYPVFTPQEVGAKMLGGQVGILISNEDHLHSEIRGKLSVTGVKELYYLSERNRIKIPDRMRPLCTNQMDVQFDIAHHCNLNCQCCTHFSPISDKYLLDINEFERDIKRLADLTDCNVNLNLMGGEPLLHPQLVDFCRIAREILPTSRIVITTNGLLLVKKENDQNGNLWQAIKDYDVTLHVTTYPIKLDYNAIDEKAKKYGIKYHRFVEAGEVIRKEKNNVSTVEKVTTLFPFDLNGNVPKYQFIGCYDFHRCIGLIHGKLYTCPIIPGAEYFNKYFHQNLEVTQNDYIDIYEAKSFEEIAEFLSHKPYFCRYCNVKGRHSLPWAISKRVITEWTNPETENRE